MPIRKPKKCEYCGVVYASKLEKCPKCNSIKPPAPPTYMGRRPLKRGKVQL